MIYRILKSHMHRLYCCRVYSNYAADVRIGLACHEISTTADFAAGVVDLISLAGVKLVVHHFVGHNLNTMPLLQGSLTRRQLRGQIADNACPFPLLVLDHSKAVNRLPGSNFVVCGKS